MLSLDDEYHCVYFPRIINNLFEIIRSTNHESYSGLVLADNCIWAGKVFYPNKLSVIYHRVMCLLITTNWAISCINNRLTIFNPKYAKKVRRSYAMTMKKLCYDYDMSGWSYGYMPNVAKVLISTHKKALLSKQTNSSKPQNNNNKHGFALCCCPSCCFG